MACDNCCLGIERGNFIKLLVNIQMQCVTVDELANGLDKLQIKFTFAK